ncbi:MAG: Fe-S cluster assembly protein SufD [Pseudomonadota bacterium]
MSVSAGHPYVEALLQGSRGLPPSPLSWLNQRRAQALERANALTVPTTRDEEWRFTDLSPLTKMHFQPVQAAGALTLTLSDIEGMLVPEAGLRLVFVDGMFAPALSALDGLPAGMQFANFAQGFKVGAALAEKHLACHVGFDDNVFAALNTSYLRDGALITLAKGVVCAAPVHLLHIATQKEAASYPRCLLIAGSGSECMLIEDFVSLQDGAYLTNAVCEIVLEADARVRHVRLQRESLNAFHIANCAVVLEKDAVYQSHAVALGARISRHNLNVVQNGEGAEMKIDGLALISGRQLADTHTLMDHARPHGKSTQLHKCIAGGAAHAVFNGKVFVREGAQLTDSAQQSRNLLLSPKAHVDTKPQLEIFADDVKCAHGATVGQIDAEQLFYLKSRGLPEAQARNLLTYAFGAEIIDRIPVPSLVARLERTVLEQTQTGQQPS